MTDGENFALSKIAASLQERHRNQLARLREEADVCLRFERESSVPMEAARAATRECLADFARELGYAENEISAAIDTAIGGR